MIHPGLGFIPQDASPEEIFAHVERMMRQGDWMQKAGEPLLSRFIDFPSLANKKVLDIGYGVGWLLNEYVRAGSEVHGIDLSHSHYAYSNYRFRNYANVCLQVASADSIPYTDNFFDFISAYGVIHHAGDDQQCFSEIYRVLKPSGKVFLMLYRRGGPKYWWRKVLRRGILGGGLRRSGYEFTKFLYSVTDAYGKDSPGAPISRHYSRAQLEELFVNFGSVDIKIFGNRHEWDYLPAHKFPLTSWLLPRGVRDRLVTLSGAYWIVNLR